MARWVRLSIWMWVALATGGCGLVPSPPMDDPNGGGPVFDPAGGSGAPPAPGGGGDAGQPGGGGPDAGGILDAGTPGGGATSPPTGQPVVDAGMSTPPGGDAGMPTPPGADAGAPGSPSPDPGTPNPPDMDAGMQPAPGNPPAPGTGPGPTVPGTDCLATGADFGPRGPFGFDTVIDGSIHYWVPRVPAGCRVPVVHFANGTFAFCGVYGQILESLASHGFLTACFESTQTGAGDQGITAIEAAMAKYPDLVDDKIGSLGHSQGGQSSVVVVELAEATWGPNYTYAGLAMQPASGFGAQPAQGPWQAVYGRVRSPIFMFSGTADLLVNASWVQEAFVALDDGIEAYNWSAEGSTHIPTPNAETIEVAIPWFRWKLLGDAAACRAFKDLRGARRWSVVAEQNETACP